MEQSAFVDLKIALRLFKPLMSAGEAREEEHGVNLGFKPFPVVWISDVERGIGKVGEKWLCPYAITPHMMSGRAQRVRQMATEVAVGAEDGAM